MPDETGRLGEHDEEVVVVEFSLTDPDYPFIGLSGAEDCRVQLEKMLPREAEKYGEYFSIRGTEPEQVLALAERHDLVEPELIASYENGGLFEFVVEGFCPARHLAERGAIPRDVVGESGEGKIVAEIPPGKDVSTIISQFLGAHPNAELLAKRRKDRLTPIFTQHDLQHAVTTRLTDRQLEVLQTAFDAGYYDPASPTTGEELGEQLGISETTIYEHLRTAERELVALLLEGDPTIQPANGN